MTIQPELDNFADTLKPTDRTTGCSSGSEANCDTDLILADAFDWLEKAEPSSIHAVVTDPPYGLVEYRSDQLHKRQTGNGGVWRIPPSFDGARRSPVPRFTVLTPGDEEELERFFTRLATLVMKALVPGAHVFIATNPLLSHHVYGPMLGAGFEKRGEIVRIVKTLRGGDRPKGAHEEFPDVSVMPRSGWEPWGLFRKPVEGRVQDNLRRWGVGGLRRISEEQPFWDVIVCPPAGKVEREIAPHPSLKPQRLMRQLTRAALPMGTGSILDPFMGSGATIAAARANGLHAVGLESETEYHTLAQRAVPLLTNLKDD
jgi:site-specific DNA-methyltransferase (adenine-specific)